MTPAEHYVEAERMLDQAANAMDRGRPHDVTYYTFAAQVHAMLATCPPARRLEGPSDDVAEGDDVTVVISGVYVSGSDDRWLYLGVPDAETGIDVPLVDDLSRELPQVRVYRDAKGGAR